MTSSNRTPSDLTISPRDRHYGKSPVSRRWWLREDPVATAILNAFSATFPEGEKFFIESVVQFKDQVVEPLKTQVKAFVRQEAMHTREHIAFNEQVTGAGYDITSLEERTKGRIAIAKARHPIAQLAGTVAMEHFTALIAHSLLTNPKVLEGAAGEAGHLWRWHSVEEIEHKSVAFDVYMAATAKLSPFKRWKIRSQVMLLTTINFTQAMSANIADLMRQDGLDPKKERGRALKLVFGRDGLMQGLLPHYLAFYMPGFHPWSLDDRKLIAEHDTAMAPEMGELVPA
ncbi:metal-dependent hydrolase [soil metagenome]